MTSRLLLITASLALAGCSDSDPSSANDRTAETSSSVAQASCVADFADSPCTLLTADRVRTSFPALPADAQQQNVPQITSCSYLWPSNGRSMEMTIAGNITKIPLDNEIGIRWIKVKTGENVLRDFKRAYRTLTDEEQAQAQASMKASLERQLANKSEAVKKAAAGLSDQVMASIEFDSIDDIGTAAAWGGTPKSRSLKVLDGTTEFEIVANISDQDAENRALAEQLAQDVIASCQ